MEKTGKAVIRDRKNKELSSVVISGLLDMRFAENFFLGNQEIILRLRRKIRQTKIQIVSDCFKSREAELMQ